MSDLIEKLANSAKVIREAHGKPIANTVRQPMADAIDEAIVALGMREGIVEGVQYQERRRILNRIETDFAQATGFFIVETMRGEA